MNLLCLQILNGLSFIGLLATFYPALIVGNGPFKSIINITNSYNNTFVLPIWSQMVIWNMCYISLIVFIVAQFFGFFNYYAERIGLYFIFLCLSNIGWVISFTIGTKVSMIISTIFILIMLILLVLMQHSCYFFGNGNMLYYKLYGDIPLSVFLGWVIYLANLNLSICLMCWGMKEISEIYYIMIMTLLFIVYNMNMFVKNNYVTSIIFLFIIISVFIKNYDNDILFYSTLLVIIITVSSILFKMGLDICRCRIERKDNDESLIYNQHGVV